MYMLLDVNTEIYPMKKKERFLMALSPALVLNTKVNLIFISFFAPCFIIANINNALCFVVIYLIFQF